jgi:hypothetical protein
VRVSVALQLALADAIWFAEFIVLKLKGAPRACPVWVKSAVLAVGQLLPVCPQQRTLAKCVGESGSCR